MLDTGYSYEELSALVEDAVALRGEMLSVPGVLLSDVQPEKVDWLWPGHLARGKLALLDGDPGVGKSTITIDIAARITRGLAWPDDGTAGVGGVVILTAEDGIADTVRPRLDAAGGDATRVRVIPFLRTSSGDERLPTIPDDLDAVEIAIQDVGAALLIVDPLMAYLGPGTNSYRDQDVRRALSPLANLAERTRVACLVFATSTSRTAASRYIEAEARSAS